MEYIPQYLDRWLGSLVELCHTYRGGLAASAFALAGFAVYAMLRTPTQNR